MNVFDAATPTSSPQRVKSDESTSRVMCEPIMFVIATVCAPRSFASFIAPSVSRVSPDCEMPITSVSGPMHGVAVDPLGGDVRLDRDAPHSSSTYRPTTAAWYAVPHARMTTRRMFAQLLVREAEALELEPPVPDTVADRLGDGLGLLVDLLEHERLVAALLGALVVPVELDLVVLDRAAVARRRSGRRRA